MSTKKKSTEQIPQKPMQQAIVETKQKIIQAVNESGLPLEVIGLIFEVFTNSIQNEIAASQNQIVAEKPETETTGE